MWRLVVAVLGVSVSLAHADEPAEVSEIPEIPPLSGGRLAGEALLGCVFAVGGGLAGALAGQTVQHNCGLDSNCGFGGLVLGGAAGLAFATPIGVYLIGSEGDQTGSFGWTLAGSAIGTVVGVGLFAVVSEQLESDAL